LADKLKNRIIINDIIILIYSAVQLLLVIIFGNLLKSYLLVFYAGTAFMTCIMIIFPRPEKPSLVHFIKTVYPLPLIYLYYRIVGFQTQISNFNYHDVFILGIEKKLLGVYPAFALQRIMEVWLNELSYFLYCLGIILPIWAIIKLYNENNLKYFENFILAIEIGCLSCLAIATVYPVAGPAEALIDYFYLNIYGSWFSIVIPFFIQFISPSLSSFPAVYFCLIVISSYYLWDFGKAYIAISFALLTGVFWGGIYLRYHYLADGIVGLIIAFMATSIAGIIYYTKHGEYNPSKDMSE